MIDDGELDWKILAINKNDPMADKLNDVDDLEKHMPGVISGIREWFRWYKTPDDKPLNAFGFDEKALDKAQTLKVIDETHDAWKKLISGETDAGKLWKPSMLTTEPSVQTSPDVMRVLTVALIGGFVMGGAGAFAAVRLRRRSSA